jgi:prephenate dehydratase
MLSGRGAGSRRTFTKEAAMATTIRRTVYFSMKTSNRAGQGARLLGDLAAQGIDLLAFTGFPVAGGAQVDFIPRDVAGFTRAARRLGLKISGKKTVFLAQGTDQPGAIAKICGKLAAARINMTAMDAVAAGGGRFGAIFWVKPKDVAKAARVLGAR